MIDPFYRDAYVTLYQGDCRLILPEIKEVASIVTDPPYGINLQPRSGRTKVIVGDSKREAKSLLWTVAEYASRLAAENSNSFFFSSWSQVWFKDVLAEWFTVKGCIVWVKNCFGLG